MRGIARQKLGYFPLSQKEAERIRRFLSFREDRDVSVLDPCAGAGAAIATITSDAKAVRHGIELDAFRAEEARLVLQQVIHGNCFDVHSTVESFSLLFENPPLSERFRGGSEPKRSYGIPVPRTHVSMVETRWCPGACDSRRSIVDLRRDPRRPLSRQSDLPSERTRVHPVQTDRCVRCAPNEARTRSVERLGRTAGQNETVGTFAELRRFAHAAR